MKTIYTIRGALCRFYMRFELVFSVILRFLAYFLIFRTIAGWAGFSGDGILNASSVHMLMALVCVLLPSRFVGLFASFIIIYNVYVVSFWGAAMVAVLLVVLYIMVARFTPDEAFLLILMPIAMQWDLFLAVSLFGGLYMGVFSILPMCGGILFWGILKIIPAFMQFSVEKLDELPAAFTEMSNYIANQLLKNENLIFLMIICCGVTLVVWVLNKLKLKHIRYVSLAVGAVFGLLCLLVGRSLSMIDLNMMVVLSAPIIGFAVMCVIEFFHMVLNYRMVQQLAFGDNEYYYYVQAVPKILGKKKNQGEIKTITVTNPIPSPEELLEEEEEEEPVVQQPVRKKPAAAKPAQKPVSRPVSKPAEKPAVKHEKNEAAIKWQDDDFVSKPVSKKPLKEAPNNLFMDDFFEKGTLDEPVKKKPAASSKKNGSVKTEGSGSSAPARSGSKQKTDPFKAQERKLTKSMFEDFEAPEELSFGDQKWYDSKEDSQNDNSLALNFFDEPMDFETPAKSINTPAASSVSQEKVDELRKRTGWSDETIKGFLAGLDEDK